MRKLRKIQAGILKHHKKAETLSLFINFLSADKNSIASFLKDLDISSGKVQRNSRDENSKSLISCHLTAKGLKKLGYTKEKGYPTDDPFFWGFSEKDKELFPDALADDWNSIFKDEVHAMVKIAGGDLNKNEEKIETLAVTYKIRIFHTEKGQIIPNNTEPFGYKDGITSIKLADKNHNPIAGQLPLVLDKYNGSFLAFMKLEQEVDKFHNEIKKMAEAIGVPESYARALVMGRFQDGTPLAISDKPLAATAQTEEQKKAIEDFNKFDIQKNKCPFHSFKKGKWEIIGTTYADDKNGFKCPEQAHIRIVNSRDAEEIIDGNFIPMVIIRRSIPYYENNKPKGLLFQCFQGHPRQFEVMQESWINGGSSYRKEKNNRNEKIVDSILASSNEDTELNKKWYYHWGNDSSKKFDFKKFVHFKGGAFFYTPSIEFFKNPLKC